MEFKILSKEKQEVVIRNFILKIKINSLTWKKNSNIFNIFGTQKTNIEIDEFLLNTIKDIKNLKATASPEFLRMFIAAVDAELDEPTSYAFSPQIIESGNYEFFEEKDEKDETKIRSRKKESAVEEDYTEKEMDKDTKRKNITKIAQCFSPSASIHQINNAYMSKNEEPDPIRTSQREKAKAERAKKREAAREMKIQFAEIFFVSTTKLTDKELKKLGPKGIREQAKKLAMLAFPNGELGELGTEDMRKLAKLAALCRKDRYGEETAKKIEELEEAYRKGALSHLAYAKMQLILNSKK